MLKDCPQREDLLRMAMGETPPGTKRELEDHLNTCADCRAEVAVFREEAARLVASGSRDDSAAARCLDETDIVQLVDGSLEPEHRAALVAHTASCATCRESVAALTRLVADPSIRHELEHLQPARRSMAAGRRFRLLAGVVAAAAVVALIMPQLSRLGNEEATPSHRAGDLSLSAPPVPLSPLGVAVGSIPFEWSSTPLADRYEVTLFDDRGTILWQVHTTDTVAVLPDSVSLLPGSSYFWRSRARIGFDRWTESELVQFSFGSAGERAR